MDENDDIILEDELATAISELFELMKGFAVGSEEWLATLRAIDTLYKWRVECAKVEQTRLIEEDRAKREEEARLANKKEKAKDTAFNVLVKTMEIGVPAAIFGICFFQGMQFEQTGAFTTNMMRLLTRLPKPGKIG